MNTLFIWIRVHDPYHEYMNIVPPMRLNQELMVHGINKDSERIYFTQLILKMKNKTS